MEKKGARLWKHGERRVWRHSPGKSEGGRFTSTPAGVKPPNGDAAEMDENGNWVKPDMPIEDKYKAGGAVGTLLGMARKLRARGGRAAFATGGMVVGPVPGTTGGRDDALPVTVPHNSYVVPAYAVAHLGGGNSDAGYAKLQKMFPEGHEAMAAGGTPIKISHGEFVVSPAAVARVGGGSLDLGNKALDQWVLALKQQSADEIKNLPGPAQ